MILTDIMAYIHNWFDRDRISGTFTIEGGDIAALDGRVLTGQYIRIVGSVLNDGVYLWPVAGTGALTDEVFSGEVWLLAIPAELIELSNTIDTWQNDHPMSQYTSESFGGYTYSYATDASGVPVTWREQFRSQLNRWRKLPC